MSTKTAIKANAISNTLGKCVGRVFASHGFLRAYHGDTQIGSTAVEDGPELNEWLEKMTAECSRREGVESVRCFCGRFYRD